MSRTVAVLTGACFALLLAAAPSQAGIWTPVSSGTTADITAVEYQSDAQLVIGTSNGQLRRWNGSAFVLAHTVGGVTWTDIEWQPGGNVVLAVGSAGAVARSSNGGVTWANVTLPNAANNFDCTTSGPAGDLDAVRFHNNNRAWIVGTDRQIWLSNSTIANVGAAGTWADRNDAGASCRIPRNIDDVATVPASDTAFFVSRDFGAVYRTTNLLASAAGLQAASAGNGFTERRRMVLDPGNPNRQWAVFPGVGGSYHDRTETQWNSAPGWAFADDEKDHFSELFDVAFEGGTVLAAGNGGRVEHSIDGATFFGDPADGSQATAGWRAVSLADAARGAIGGQGGEFAMTTQANVMPPLPVPTTPGGGGSGTGTGTGTGSGGGATPIVVPPTTTPGLPRPTFSLTGFRGAGATARRVRGNRVLVRVRGRLSLPRGVSRRRGCRGRVRMRVTRGRRTVGRRTARVRSNCRFTVSVRVRRSRLSPRATRVRVVLTFSRNPFLAVRSQTLSIPIT